MPLLSAYNKVMFSVAEFQYILASTVLALIQRNLETKKLCCTNSYGFVTVKCANIVTIASFMH